MNKMSVRDLKDLKGKKVLVRCDFNVPMKDGKITVGECKAIEKAAGSVAPAFYAAAKAPRLQDSISETMDKAKKDGKELGSKLEDTLNNQLPQLFDDAMNLFRDQMRQYNKEKPEAPTNL